MTLQLSRLIFEETNMKFHKIPVGAELFQADRQTDRQTVMTNQVVAFRNFTHNARFILFAFAPCT